MYDKKKTMEIIDKLIEFTQHDRISWTSSANLPFLQGSDIRIDMVYVTEYIGRKFRIYKRHYKHYINEEEFFIDDEVCLEFIDNSELSLGKLQHTSNVDNLLTAIQYQNPMIKNFYDDLFK